MRQLYESVMETKLGDGQVPFDPMFLVGKSCTASIIDSKTAKGKDFDTANVMGPWLVTADELPDPQAIPLQLSVNGEQKQNSSTADMIFPVAEIVAYLSQFMTLLPGDLVITGTPEGVGLGVKPTPVFLKRGDVMTLSAGILGTQRQQVR